ncbi:MAG: hypothetical protein M3P18_07075 [Actinomycetota bacterium]|nr:hypothetical protein [Actinomycetota bacterium]
MPEYSLDLDGPDGTTYVPSQEFPNAGRVGETFERDGWTWQVIAVAAKQFDAPGEPPETLRCVPA